MYKATREFIKARQPFAKYSIYLHTSVQKVGGGERNQCFKNSYNVAQASKETSNKVSCMSGWLVQPYDKEKNCTAIVQHWWNVDSTGRHFDTSPFVATGEEYVMDFDLYEFSREHFERIKSNVTMSLLLQNGKFSILTDADSMRFTDVSELRTELFFNYV